MRFWQIKYSSRHPWVISVNISGKQFNNAELSRQVENILEHSGLDSHALTLELTENIIMEDVSSTLNTLLSLKALGLRLSIDDFGTRVLFAELPAQFSNRYFEGRSFLYQPDEAQRRKPGDHPDDHFPGQEFENGYRGGRS